MIMVLATVCALFASLLPATEEMHGGHHEQVVASSLELPMSREGSGTSWQPDASPMAMIMARAASFDFMIHGNAFLVSNIQGSKRGDRDFNSINWMMAAVSHKLWSGQISARTMLSLEPLTMGGSGYPLLYQTGETWKGERIHDRQHPHDLFMELALKYVVPIQDTVGLLFYVAPAGEPALGPTAFPHRVSARSNPLAPLGHHWFDATHITFGVVTLGLFTRQWLFEGSWFNGREPDENRYNIDLRIPDSFAGRISYNPINELSLQISYGFLKTPESLEPDVSVHKITSSVSSNFKPWTNGNIASSIMFGVNIPNHGKTTPFGLIETDFDVHKHHTLFGRIEGGAKTGEDLVLTPALDHKTFFVGALSLGYIFRFPTLWKFAPGIGGVGTVYATGHELGSFYGGPVQLGGMVFANLRLADHE